MALPARLVRTRPSPDLLVLKVHRVFRARSALLDLKEHKGLREPKAFPVTMGLLEPRVLLVLQALPAARVQSALPDLQALLEPQAALALLVRLARPALKVSRGRLELKGRQALQAQLVRMVLQVQ